MAQRLKLNRDELEDITTVSIALRDRCQTDCEIPADVMIQFVDEPMPRAELVNMSEFTTLTYCEVTIVAAQEFKAGAVEMTCGALLAPSDGGGL